MWTNGRASGEALQGISLQGPVTAVINSSSVPSTKQSFSLQPTIDEPPELKTSYANVTLAGEHLAQSMLQLAFLDQPPF